ncbi:hypothetical protein E2C01_070270 [Portunus trituberculatus]|uniref:Uncharacterized protein n=1 Tax=Portunus trituberculatus TaxID=210409 RepID=A0A5B7I0W0_PORTR|nr:hypothetical protein [Portunus trituberculatus]
MAANVSETARRQEGESAARGAREALDTPTDCQSVPRRARRWSAPRGVCATDALKRAAAPHLRSC